MKLRVCLSLVVMIMAASGAVPGQTPGLHRAGGLLFQDPHAVTGMVELTLIPIAPGARDASTLGAVDLSAQMPPVGDQGQQGSCVAWSIGYYDKTHTEYVEHLWDLTQTSHQVSPAFIYNQINGGRDYGAYFTDATMLICDQGACMLSDFPYSQSNCTNWPSESAFSHAIPYRGQTAYYTAVNSDAGINAVKQRLANGLTCVLGINVYSNFDNIQNYNYTYTVHDRYGANRGGHGVCIVGYDDNKVTTDGTGAFKLVNSWGTSWGQAGYWWMSYYAVKTTSGKLSQGYVYYESDRNAYTPTLLARTKLTHSSRDRIGITFGIGRSSSPSWTKTFRQFQILSGTIAAQAFPANNLVFDLSDGASYLPATDSVYLQCIDKKRDNLTGTINFLSAQYLPWGTTGVSSQTPVTIPDYNTAVKARLKVPTSLLSRKVEPTKQARPSLE